MEMYEYNNDNFYDKVNNYKMDDENRISNTQVINITNQTEDNRLSDINTHIRLTKTEIELDSLITVLKSFNIGNIDYKDILEDSVIYDLLDGASSLEDIETLMNKFENDFTSFCNGFINDYQDVLNSLSDDDKKNIIVDFIQSYDLVNLNEYKINALKSIKESIEMKNFELNTEVTFNDEMNEFTPFSGRGL